MLQRLAVLLVGLAMVACAPAGAEPEVEPVGSSRDELDGDEDFERAREKVDELRGDLASNQSHLRGVLTGAQITAYSAAFWKLDRAVAATNDYAAKALALAANLEEATSRLESDTSKVTNCGGPRSLGDERVARAKDLYGAAKSLSTAAVLGTSNVSPAFAVRRFYRYLLEHPDLSRCLDKDPAKLEKDLGENHAQVMVQVSVLEPNLSALDLLRRTFDDLRDASPNVDQLGTSLERFAMSQADRDMAAASSTSSGELAAMTLLVLGLGQTTDGATAHERYQASLRNALIASRSVERLARAVELLGGTVESARYQSLATKVIGFARVAGRIASGVSAVTSAIQLLEDLRADDDDRLLYFARIAADAAALQASLVALAGLSQLVPVAGAIVLLTQAVVLIAEYWHQRGVTKRRRADTKAVLRTIGFSGDVADAFAEADRETLRTWTGKGEYEVGLSPTAIQDLAKYAVPLDMGAESFFTLADNPRWIGNAGEVARLFGLSDADRVRMVKTTTGNTDGTIARVAFDGCVMWHSGVFASTKDFFAAIDDCRGESFPDEDEAMDRLATFLRAR
jgi:hypothetical protein